MWLETDERVSSRLMVFTLFELIAANDVPGSRVRSLAVVRPANPSLVPRSMFVKLHWRSENFIVYC